MNVRNVQVVAATINPAKPYLPDVLNVTEALKLTRFGESFIHSALTPLNTVLVKTHISLYHCFVLCIKVRILYVSQAVYKRSPGRYFSSSRACWRYAHPSRWEDDANVVPNTWVIYRKLIIYINLVSTHPIQIRSLASKEQDRRQQIARMLPKVNVKVMTILTIFVSFSDLIKARRRHND